MTPQHVGGERTIARSRLVGTRWCSDRSPEPFAIDTSRGPISAYLNCDLDETRGNNPHGDGLHRNLKYKRSWPDVRRALTPVERVPERNRRTW